MKKLALLLFLTLSIFPARVIAKYNPLDRQNNKFGIHIVDPNDISDAAALVNSSGGDWGYVTLVIQENDRHIDKWQVVFNSMRRLHLIPIVRLATQIDGSSWTKPNESDSENWVSFLDKLNWPVENRYVILFNEPNHAKEWGNSLNPEEYGKIAVVLAKKLKEKNEDFFILPAGFDASAGITPETTDEYDYLQKVISSQPEFLDLIDGWTSHSYPNPGFSAPVQNSGRGSLASFQWEINMLKKLGLKKNLSVFITETGWLHSNGSAYRPGYLSPDTVSKNLVTAAQTIWSDKSIVAITPFILNYQSAPFDHFSWKKVGSGEFYPFFYTYQQIEKNSGRPRQREKYEFIIPVIPDVLITGSRYTINGKLKNIGQGILSSEDRYDITLTSSSQSFEFLPDPLPIIEPNQDGPVTVHLQTPENPGNYFINTAIVHENDIVYKEEKNVTIVPPPSLSITANLGWRRSSNSSDVTVLIYDTDNNLLHKYSGVILTDGSAHVERLTNILPGRRYRIVILVPYYLPSQKISELTATDTNISLKRLIPVDFNTDGHFSFSDLKTFFRLPLKTILSLFIG